MHNHDDDLIADVAGGHLAGTDYQRASADINSCPRCRAELEAQLFARASVRSLGDSQLTQFERSRLHHVVEQQASSVPKAWYVRLAPALGAAAALVLVVGIGLNLALSETQPVGDLAAEATVQSTEAQTSPAAEAPSAAEPPAGAVQESAPLRAAATAPMDFGDLTETELQDQLEVIATQQVTEEATAGADFSAEAGLAPECIEETDQTYVGYASVSGVAIELYRTDESQAVAYESDTCQIVAQYP